MAELTKLENELASHKELNRILNNDTDLLREENNGMQHKNTHLSQKK